MLNNNDNLQQFSGKTLVIKYGGNAMTEDSLKAGFAQDIVHLQKLGIKPVIVHGGGPQIDQALKLINKDSKFVQGIRVTDEQTMQIVEWVLIGQVQQEIMALINFYGESDNITALGISGKSANFIQAKKLLLPEINNPSNLLDVGFVGEITKINPQILFTLQENNIIPIIAPIAMQCADGKIHSYNINADIVAAQVAKILQAERLIMMTNITGVLDKNGNLLNQLNATQIQNLIIDGTLSGGMLPKIASAIDASLSGVGRVQIVDGRISHSILQALQDENFGTIITNN